MCNDLPSVFIHNALLMNSNSMIIEYDSGLLVKNAEKEPTDRG